MGFNSNPLVNQSNPPLKQISCFVGVRLLLQMITCVCYFVLLPRDVAEHGVRWVWENPSEYKTNVKHLHLAWILELQQKCKMSTSCQNMGPWAMFWQDVLFLHFCCNSRIHAKCMIFTFFVYSDRFSKTPLTPWFALLGPISSYSEP